MKKKISLCSFILLSIVYIELVFKYTIFNSFVDNSIFRIILFSIPITLSILFISSFFKHKYKNVILTFFISTFIIFVAQIIYYNIYHSIFSFNSVAEGNNVLFDYFNFILDILINNMAQIILLILPIISFIVIVKKTGYFNYPVFELKQKLSLVILIIVTHLIAVSSLLISNDNNNIYSELNLYRKIHAPVLSTQKFGLLTTLRLDVERMIIEIDDNNLQTVDNPEDIGAINEPEDLDKTKKVKDVKYNVMEIDWDNIIEKESNMTIKSIHEYLSKRKPTNQNEYTSLFKGKNLILFLAESFDSIAIDPEITPTLYRLSEEGFNFTNFYTPLYPVSTSDGEFITLTSLVPRKGIWSMANSYKNYQPFSLGNMFSDIGYKSKAFHNHTATYYDRYKSHPNLGYEFFAVGRGLNINSKIWPESDLEMIEVSTDMFFRKDPFYTYMITVSGHLEYSKYSAMANKNWNYVKHLNYSDKVKRYMSCHVELDKALEELIKRLEEDDLLNDTVIAICADHYPYGLTLDELNEKSKYKRDENFDMHKLPFIIWNNETEGKEIDKLASSFDILPTISNLFGLEYDSRLLMGNDIFSDNEQIVMFANRSWITEDAKYNSLSNEVIKLSDKEIDEEYITRINNIIYNRFQYSKFMQDHDYYRKLFK